jgi:hypothetical protein
MNEYRTNIHVLSSNFSEAAGIIIVNQFTVRNLEKFKYETCVSDRLNKVLPTEPIEQILSVLDVDATNNTNRMTIVCCLHLRRII